MSKKTKTEVKITENKDTITTQKTIEEKYQKKTQKEHILLRPDTYIGDISLQNESLWVYDRNNKKIIKKEISYVPGLYKIFDEILVNARDHTVNDHTCDTIKVDIDQEKNEISVTNNGKGIDIEMHQEHNMWVPEMIFGELLTSTNYDDTQKRTTGGRNGYGAKLTNVFSKFFSIETVDSGRKLKFYQEFRNNLSERTKPKITELKAEKPSSFTKITFEPDLTKFKLTELTDDIIALMSKRVIDMAGVSNKVKVYLNDKKIDVNNFKKYISLYDLSNETNNSKKKESIIYDETDRWKLGIMYVPDGVFEQISFVNGICTYHGGNHVDYVLNQIIKKIEAVILKKYKKAIIKSSTLKDNLVIFLDSVIDNPAFTSQTKETLKTKASDFGSVFEPSDKLIKKILSTGIIDQIINMVKMKEESLKNENNNKYTKGQLCSINGYNYEKKIYNILNKCYLNDKKFNTQKDNELGGSKNINDIQCNYIYEKDINIEIKKFKTPDYVQNSLMYDKNKNKYITTQRNKNPIECCKLFDKLISNNIIFNNEIAPFIEQNITHKEWLEIKKNTDKWNDKYIDIPNDTIKKMYCFKGCNYIQIENYGLYHLGNDICNFGVPEFIVKQKLRIRTKVHNKTNKKGFCDLSVVVSCCPDYRSMQLLEKSKYSLDNVEKLPINLIYRI